MLVGQKLDTGFECGFAALKTRNLGSLPHNPAFRFERDQSVGCRDKRLGPDGQFACQHLGRGVARGAAMNPIARAVGREAEAIEPPDKVVLDQDLSVRRDVGRHLFLVAQTANENARPPVDEALR